jgi:tetrahydromethanopterin S-methyltransferase subunit G
MNPDLGISQSQIEDIGKRLRKVEKWVHAGIQKVGGDYF